MFNWFKPRAREVIDLEARLSSDLNPGIFGEAEFEGYDDGSWAFTVSLSHKYERLPDLIEVVVHGMKRLTLVPEKQYTYFRRTHNDGDLPFEPVAGMLLEIQANGEVIVSGTLKSD